MYISASSRLPKRHLPDTLRSMSDHAHALQVIKRIAVDGVHNYASAILVFFLWN